MLPTSGGTTPERLLTLRYKSKSWVKLAISLGTTPCSLLKCKYNPDKVWSWPISGGIFPVRSLPCKEMLTTWPSSLQAIPSKEPLHGSVESADHDERMTPFGSKDALIVTSKDKEVLVSMAAEEEVRIRMQKKMVEERKPMFGLQEKVMWGKLFLVTIFKKGVLAFVKKILQCVWLM